MARWEPPTYPEKRTATDVKYDQWFTYAFGAFVVVMILWNVFG